MVEFEGRAYCVDAASVLTEKHEDSQPEGEEEIAGDAGASDGYAYYEPQYSYGGGSSSGGNAASSAPSTSPAAPAPSTPSDNGGGATTAPSTDEGEWTPPKL